MLNFLMMTLPLTSEMGAAVAVPAAGKPWVCVICGPSRCDVETSNIAEGCSANLGPE